MTITVYKSTDGSAPVLTGQAGALITLLDACLVNGYGSKSPAGWAKPFSATSIGCYRAASGNRLYLQVIDTGLSSARSARVRGYESMSAHDTGSNPFPTSGQLANGMGAFKSGTADSTARAWCMVAEDQLFYLFMQAESVTGEWHVLAFGDIDTYAAGDAYATILIASTENAAAATLDDNQFSGCVTTLTTQTNHYIARPYTGIAGAAACGKMAGNLTGSLMGSSGMTYPAPVDNGLYIEPVRVAETGTFRGVMPGLYAPLHNKPLSHYQTITSVIGLSGRTLMALDLASPTGTATAQCCLDITGPWR